MLHWLFMEDVIKTAPTNRRRWIQFGSLFATFSIDRFLNAFRLPFGSLLITVGTLLLPFHSLLAPFGSLFVPFWFPFDALWLTFAHRGTQFSDFWNPPESFWTFFYIFHEKMVLGREVCRARMTIYLHKVCILNNPFPSFRKCVNYSWMSYNIIIVCCVQQISMSHIFHGFNNVFTF